MPKRINPDALRQKIKDLVQSGRENAMDLCWACHTTCDRTVPVGGAEVPIWQAWGFDSWEDYVGIELDLHITTAYAYRKVWEVFYVELQGAWNKDLLLGITKMKHLASLDGLLTRRNVNGWLKKAAGVNCNRLMHMVHSRENHVNFAATLTESQMESVRATLDKAKEYLPRGDTMSRGDLLVEVLKQWAQMQSNVHSIKKVTKTRRNAA